jgi:CBS domain-containing protein
MLANGLRELPVTDADGRLLGLIDDHEVAQAFKGNRVTPRS